MPYRNRPQDAPEAGGLQSAPEADGLQYSNLSSNNEILSWLNFKRRIKSYLLFAGIIRSSPYSPR